MKKCFLAILLLPFFILPGSGSAKVLDLSLVMQEQDQWCWAAASTSILLYYNVEIEQCEVAEYTRTKSDWHDFGDVNCCVDPSKGCNYWNYNWGKPGSIEDILNNWSVEVNNLARHLAEQEVIDEISTEKPFIIRWGWATGGGHFVTGYGIDNSLVNYMDPWEGHKTALYSWVVSGGYHEWTHTQTIRQEPAGFTLNVNSSGVSNVSIDASPLTYAGTTDYTRPRIPDGTSITLTAPASKEGVNFLSWAGCDSTDAVARTCAVTMNTDKTVTVSYGGDTPKILPGVLMLLLDDRQP